MSQPSTGWSRAVRAQDSTHSPGPRPRLPRVVEPRGSKGGRGGASLRCPRVVGPVCAALAAGSAARSRGGGGLRAPSAPAPPAAAAPPPWLATPRGLQWRGGGDAKPGQAPAHRP